VMREHIVQLPMTLHLKPVKVVIQANINQKQEVPLVYYVMKDSSN